MPDSNLSDTLSHPRLRLPNEQIKHIEISQNASSDSPEFKFQAFLNRNLKEKMDLISSKNPDNSDPSFHFRYVLSFIIF